MINSGEVVTIEATLENVPLLVEHHRRMFEEILVSQEKDPASLDKKKLDAAYQKKMQGELGKTCKAWLAQYKGEFVASGAVSLLSMVPVPFDYSYHVAYIHSIFTENQFRGRGIAGYILCEIIEYCRDKEVNRLILNASDAGRPIYERFGFEIVENSMRMSLR